MEQYANKTEVDFQFKSLEKDMNNLGSAVRELKQDTKDDMAAVWVAINGMLAKVALIVGTVTTGVLFIFKIIEFVGTKH